MEMPIKRGDLRKSLKNVDLFICSSSFENRCFPIAKEIKENYKPSKSVVFYSENEFQEIVDNAKALGELLIDSDPTIVALNTDRPLYNATSINKTLNVLFSERIFNDVLIDITTFTHETLLALYRLLEFKKENFKNLHIVYVCATKYSTDVEDTKLKWLSSGISSIRTVVGYPGVSSPARNNHLIVLFGFESDRTKSLIEELQFDTISLGFGAEGKSITSDLQKLNYSRHNDLMNYYSNAHKFELSLIDPIETKNNLLAQIEKFPHHNTVIAAMNTKISTIGAALAAIENPKIQLIYAKPVEYNVNYSEAGESIFLFKII